MANRPHQFRLGDNTQDESPHLNNGEQPEWWSRPISTTDLINIPGTNLITSLLTGSNGRTRTRKIFHQSGNSLHPAAFTEEQFEELKNLIPNSCKIRGCYTLFADPYPYGAMQPDTYTVTNNVCLYHRAMGETYNGDGHNNNPPPTTQTIQFTIGTVEKVLPDIDYFWISLNPHIMINGAWISHITISGDTASIHYQNGDLSAGNTITITNAQFGQNSIENDGNLNIGHHFDDIQVVSSSGSLFPEVQRRNQEWTQEEEVMALLSEELLKVIEKNQKVVQEAQQWGLNLPRFLDTALDFFEEETFQFLDESQPLNSPDNSQINANNEKIKQVKLNLKSNIYRIYNNNKRKLDEKKNRSNTNIPKSELEKLREEVKQKIFEVLNDKYNLRYINLTTLANGKYQNWEEDIDKLATSSEINDYVGVFLTALKEAGAKEKEQAKNKKDRFKNDNSQKPENNIIDDNTKKMINNLPLAAAKNAAKIKIRELFNKYNPDLEKLKEVWGGEKNWMAYLEKCDSPEKVVAFLEKLERAMLNKQTQSRGNNKNKKPAPKNSWILPLLLIITLVVLISLVIIIKLRYKRKKIK